jgi:hypothetical protein
MWEDDELNLDDDEEENNYSEFDNEDVILKLQDLVVKRWLCQRTVKDMLSIFRFCGIRVPATSRGLFKNSKSKQIDVNNITCGEYYHYGIEKSLMSKKMTNLSGIETIEVDIGIDGIPIFKSLICAMWPILGRTVNTIYKKPFIIGASVGRGKPGNVNKYLQGFVNEMKHLNSRGLKLEDGTVKTVRIRLYSCDTPARTFTTATAGHASKEGIYMSNNHV